jgi:glutathione S-transferase
VTDDIILHHYDASPFTQKAIKMLAIKGARWRSVIQPMIAPKPDLVALTGGYRGTPVMQIGADVYVDSQMIAAELERRIPAPTLFPGGAGVARMLSDFGEAYFRAGLDIAIRELSPQWDRDFYRDRDAVFPDIDFAEREARFPDACARLRAGAALIDAQLADGRAFLMGAAPGLADIQVYVVNWFTRAAFSFVEDLFSQFRRLKPWEARMAALGEGTRTEATAATAFDAARNAVSTTSPLIDKDDPLGFTTGARVRVSPLTSSRGESIGDLVALTAEEVAIRPESAAFKSVVVHFPRLGYAVTRAS